MAGYKDLRVWQISKEMAVKIYDVTNEEPLSKDFGLKDQMRRAAVSVCSNIAEGEDRGSNRDSMRYFRIAKGSLAELNTQLEIAFEIGALKEDIWQVLDQKMYSLGCQIGALIKKRAEKVQII